jgi:tetratricopeptide (TPR) repeat protein
MAKWAAFPYDDADYSYDFAQLKKLWSRLHAGDAEAWPTNDKIVAAWALFHAGDFRKAVDAGVKAGGGGVSAANKAQCIYAHYLEQNAEAQLALYLEAAARAEAQQRTEPQNPNAWYWQAYALGRYGQGISVVKALAQGLGGKVKTALERTIALAPGHADAHIALGSFHAEVIDHVGRLIGRTQGADAATGLKMYRRALKLDPASVIGRLELASGLLKIDGEKGRKEAGKLLAQAAAATPRDAMERLDVEAALAEMAAMAALEPR